jgi:hypothetical protein
MAVNQTQSQTLTYCDVDMENNCFSYETLYVAFSIVERFDHLYVYRLQNKTLTMEYKKVFT